MSIYCTILTIEDERQLQQSLQAAGIKYIHFSGRGEVRNLNRLPKDNLDAPIVYRGSNVLPSDGDQRGGSVSLASIPDHISRSGRDDAPEGSRKPWLRLSVNKADVVLTERQVKRLHYSLECWLSCMARKRKRDTAAKRRARGAK